MKIIYLNGRNVFVKIKKSSWGMESLIMGNGWHLGLTLLLIKVSRGDAKGVAMQKLLFSHSKCWEFYYTGLYDCFFLWLSCVFVGTKREVLMASSGQKDFPHHANRKFIARCSLWCLYELKSVVRKKHFWRRNY